jgi:hypothetical protein
MSREDRPDSHSDADGQMDVGLQTVLGVLLVFAFVVVVRLMWGR